MKSAEKFLIAFCIMFLIASSAFSINNKSTFGPKIKGVQLGMEMSLSNLVNWLINLERLPFSLAINDDRNAKVSNNSITIKFNGTGRDLKNFRITRALGSFADFRQIKWELNDLLSAVEAEGFINFNIYYGNMIAKLSQPSDDMITFDEDKRVASFKLYKSDFVRGFQRHEDFLRDFTAAYNIPFNVNEMRGKMWHYRNINEGWQISYYFMSKNEGFITLEKLSHKSMFE